MADVLVDQIARFVADYRDAGEPPSRMLEAVLGAFPAADASTYAIAIGEANRRRRADVGNG